MQDNHAAAVHIVVAGLLVRDQQVLLCHRSAERKWYPNVWDLPGGHVHDAFDWWMLDAVSGLSLADARYEALIARALDR
jgi:ADP-ribose pyrophosphatase YjhB (NUDIX family)